MSGPCKRVALLVATLMLLAVGVAGAESGFADAVSKVKDSVVTVLPAAAAGRSGTGFVVNTDGLILTNKHVLGGKTAAQVKLRSGETIPAKVVKTASESDLCLLQVERKHLPAVQFVASATLKQGDDVAAVGAPLGLDNTVTKGVLSNLSRDIEGQKYLQIDAALNEGNSGGPVINAEGNVVGVATAKAKEAQNVGFAIPTETVLNFLDATNTSYQAVLGDTPENKPAGGGKATQASGDKTQAKEQPGPDIETQPSEKNPLNLPPWAMLVIAAVIAFIVALVTATIVAGRIKATLPPGTYTQSAPPGQTWGTPAPQPPARREDLSDIDIELK